MSTQQENDQIPSSRGVRMIRVVPSMLTLCNLLCGFAAIFYATRVVDFDIQGAEFFALSGADQAKHLRPLTIAAMLIFAGMVFDALDGRVARMTRQTSDLGEQLDSMADMVTFGLAPAFIVIHLANLMMGLGEPFTGENTADYLSRTVLVVGGAYSACCALRLARFNIEIDQPEESDHMSFKGLPSPAAAGTVASLVLLHQSHLSHDNPFLAKLTAILLVVITLLVAVAMVSNVRYSHLLNKYVRGRAPFHHLALTVLVVAPLLIVPQWTLATGFVIYAVFSPIRSLFSRKSASAGAASSSAFSAESDDSDADDEADSHGPPHSDLRIG